MPRLFDPWELQKLKEGHSISGIKMQLEFYILQNVHLLISCWYCLSKESESVEMQLGSRALFIQISKEAVKKTMQKFLISTFSLYLYDISRLRRDKKGTNFQQGNKLMQRKTFWAECEEKSLQNHVRILKLWVLAMPLVLIFIAEFVPCLSPFTVPRGTQESDKRDSFA